MVQRIAKRPSNLDSISETKQLITNDDAIKNAMASDAVSKISPTAADTAGNGGFIITPSSSISSPNSSDSDDDTGSHDATVTRARRSLFVPVRKAVASSAKEDEAAASKEAPPTPKGAKTKPQTPGSSVITPDRRRKRKLRLDSDDDDASADAMRPAPKRRLLFGRMVKSTYCQPNVKSVYSIVKKLTGAIGGNGYSGPIYGELTMASMQKMIDHMMEYAELDSSSRFLDVGSGIGKPNLHVAQYPGVEFSCGVELEHVRWNLGMVCLKAILNRAMNQRDEPDFDRLTDEEIVKGNTAFLHRNIMEANSFDPFTHVYMFSIGFPPDLWDHLSTMWNTSSAKYLICYLNPRDLIETYDFDVELVSRMPTSMHGSKEGHLGYVYKRVHAREAGNKSHGHRRANANSNSGNRRVKCDPIFQEAYDLVCDGLEPLHKAVTQQTNSTMNSGRRTRSRGMKLTR